MTGEPVILKVDNLELSGFLPSQPSLHLPWTKGSWWDLRLILS